MSEKMVPEIRRTGPDEFPRYVIVENGSVPAKERRFWNGQTWVEGLRSALLYAHPEVVRADLEKIAGKA